MEKICVVRGEGFRLKKHIKNFDFRWDWEAKVWFRIMEVDENETAIFDAVVPGIEPKRMRAEEFAALLSGLLWEPKKIEVAFE